MILSKVGYLFYINSERSCCIPYSIENGDSIVLTLETKVLIYRIPDLFSVSSFYNLLGDFLAEQPLERAIEDAASAVNWQPAEGWVNDAI